MRSLMKAVAARAGLAPREKVERLTQSLDRAHEKIAELKAALEQARNENRSLKGRFDEANARMSELRDADSEKFGKRLAKAQEEVERAREREERHRTRLAELQDKAQGAERSLRLSREQLMAVEVKLDIIEGAITVLDRRTRAALSASAQGTSAETRSSR